MTQYTTNQNNHYIQAAWTGTFWGIPNKKKRERYWKVYSFNIPKFLKYDEIPSFEELKNNKIVHCYSDAEDFFKSDFILYDNLDPEFAHNCEKFLSTIEEIHNNICSYQTSTLPEKRSKEDFEKKIIPNNIRYNNALKHYISLKLCRTNRYYLNLSSQLKNLNNCLLDEFISKECEKLKLTTDEINFLQVNSKNFDINTINFLKQHLTYLSIKSDYWYYLLKFNNLKYMHIGISTDLDNNVLSTNFLSDLPFISNEIINSPIFYSAFYKFLISKEEKIIQIYEINYLKNHTFQKDLNTLFDNFVFGVLSDKVTIMFCPEYNILSDLLFKFLKDTAFYLDQALCNSSSFLIFRTEKQCKEWYDTIISPLSTDQFLIIKETFNLHESMKVNNNF